jgi:nucleoside-diphosphate-sugar epimerase
MKYFITGISGFIGSNLARQIVTDGHTVNAIIRGPAPEEFQDHPRINFFKADLQSVDNLKEAMEGCDVVFHLAAFARPWAKNPDDFYQINVVGAVNVFDAAFAAGVKKVVFTSSGATMSPSPGREPVNESTIRTLPYFNAYEVTKAKAEEKAREFCQKGLHIVIVNPTRVYGPGPLNPSNAATRMIAGFQKGTWRIIPGDGTKMGNYVYIDNIVHGHMLAAQNGRAGERYILGGENLTFNEFFGILGKITGINRLMIHLPLPVMMATARLMEVQAPLTGIPAAITADFVKKYLCHWSLSSDKAINELGYSITPFASGAEKTLEWLGNIN